MTDLDASLVHPTYRHLDRRIRLAGLPLGQWVQLLAAAAAAYALAQVLPFGATYDLSVAVTIAGVPVAAALAAGTATNPLAVLAALARWRRLAKLYPSAKAASATGYVLVGDEPDGASR